ncbi:LysE family transporter [Reyranella sp. MMS21-HV4-11]|uniref:LysE family transporter n=1 Tax=Reyranella humidisoli TaxID=2849149 RepID=A0ABS6IVJ3_9HYPH|nr:LysE family transporter [Reyranella sp. MMS21-HV4-11]MBU8877245.1 LysE family transporter [Reyranella sp. MMS21-HV4-11]
MLLSLLVASLLVMGSPGPSTISVTAVGAAFGLRRSIAYTSGLIAGTVLVLLAVATGVVAMLLALPRIAPVLLVASVGYILYLAFRIATAPPLAMHDASRDAPSFGGGLLLALANPKAYVAIAAVFTGSGLPASVKIVVLAGMVVLIHGAWLAAGTAFGRVLRDPMWSRRVNVWLAAALVAVTVYSLT